ncbi:MAG: lipopolysaccharide biosynthesis protein, partial [Janthinobacterium sp.]
MSATFLGQLITFAATPLLTRLYSPGEFGILGVYVGLLGVISVVAHLRYEMAIPLPLRRGAALQVVGLALACLLAFSALLLVLGLGAGQRILALAGSAVLAPYYWLLPVGLLLTGNVWSGAMYRFEHRRVGSGHI